MTQNEKQSSETLLPINHLKAATGGQLENQWLEAIKLFRLRIAALRKLPNVLQELGHLQGSPTVTSLIGGYEITLGLTRARLP